MIKLKSSPSLRQVVLRIVLYRFLLPLIILVLAVLGGLSSLEEKRLATGQKQISQSMINMMDYHVEQGESILNTLAMAAESSQRNSLSDLMNWSWKSYSYFDTLYYLNRDSAVNLMIPSDSRYDGIDMSRIVDENESIDKNGVIISKPFISIRTGEPTVYLIKRTSDDGYIVGELNLGLIQREINKINEESSLHYVFVMDQYGTLLAHPSTNLVSQQTNMSNLKVFKNAEVKDESSIYQYEGKNMIGIASKSQKTGWVVVCQTSVIYFFYSYFLGIIITIIVLLAFWIILAGNLTKQFKRYVINPLEEFSDWTNELALGDFRRENLMLPSYVSFSELNKLEVSFNHMSDKLKSREDSLKDALKIKDEFISLISHEFKTPLNVIDSALQLIEKVYLNQISDRVGEIVSSIKINTFRQLRLANNLIDITKLNSEEVEKNTRSIDIVKATELIIEAVDEYVTAKNIAISFDSNTECRYINIDFDKYQRILLNLIANSVKFTDEEGEISVIFVEDSKDNCFELKIIDTGVGIPKEKQEIIFKQFGQVDSNLNRQAEGIGVGLFLVKLLVNSLGGTITFESELDFGSTFIIKLPIQGSKIQGNNEDYTEIRDKLTREVKIEFSDVYL